MEHHREVGRADRAETSSVVAIGSTRGSRAAQLPRGLTSGGPPAGERAAARSPRQTATEREAAHGATVPTPISVSTSTASSPRSPLGSAWTTMIRGWGSGDTTTSAASTASRRLPVACTTPG